MSSQCVFTGECFTTFLTAKRFDTEMDPFMTFQVVITVLSYRKPSVLSQ